MKLEGEYAIDKSQRAQRISSIVVIVVWFGLVFYSRGLVQAFKTITIFALPLGCIWFPEALARYTGNFWNRGHPIDERSHPTLIRYAGWFLLLVVPLLLLTLFAQKL